VVLVQLLRILHSAVQRGHKVLSDSDDRLDEDQDVGDEPEDGVRGDEVGAAVADLVVFDYDEAGEGGEEGDVVEGGVRVGAFLLLFGGVGWLDDEDALDEEDEGGGVEELRGLELVASCAVDTCKCGGHTGCAEKRITSWLKTLPHTIAASCVRLVSAAASCCPWRISVYIRSKRQLALQLPCLCSWSVSVML
jgi:hypothetical protein